MSRRQRKRWWTLPAWTRPYTGLAPVGLVIALVAGAPLLTAALGRDPDREGGFAAGYDRLADAIAQRRWLAVSYGDDGEPKIGLRQDAVGQDPRLRHFVNNSYLRDDFRDPAVWRLSDDGLWVEGIDPYAHRIEKPVSDGGAWSGHLRFRGGVRSAVTLADMAHPEREPVTFEASGGAPTGCDIVMPTRQVEPLGARRSLSICVRDGLLPPRSAASVLLVGDRLFVRVQNVAPMEIRVGRRDANARTDGEVRLTPLPAGEVLTLRWNRAVLRLQARAATPDISHAETNGARTYYPGLKGIAQSVEQGLRGQPPRAVRLSLDASLQETAQNALSAQATAIRMKAPEGAKPDPGEAFKGSVTVMDPISGQVLAVATYPLDEDELAPAQRRTRRGRMMVAQNHNLDRLPIGSMAKGPFSLAILDADPALATLKVQGGTDARVRTVMGMDLGQGGFDNHGLGMTDFPTFLEHSNNRYALALMMMGFRDPRAPEPPPRRQAPWVEGWSLEGRTRTDAPPLPVYGDAAAPGAFGWVLQPPVGHALAWAERLSRLFTLDSGQASGCRYEVSVWRGVAGLNPRCDSAFAAASPERERLGLDAISNMRTDYLMSVLGGGRSTWSTIKVAEVYSRIVTGRMVRARMTVGPAEPADLLPLRHPQTRGPVLEGLRRVMATGTAGWLGREFAAMGYGPDVRLYGKTGTMKVAGPGPQDLGNVVLRDLAAHACGLRWDVKAGALKFGAVLPKTRAEAADQVLALTETRCRVRVAGNRQTAELVAAEMQRHACGYRNCVPVGFTPLADGRVTSLPERDTEEPLVDGHAIAMVAARMQDERVAGGLTIVVNLQDKRTTEAPALAVAAAVLRSPAARAWIEHGGTP